MPFEITVQEGWNKIEISRVDPTLIVDRFVIETKEGALGTLLLGPAESPNTITQQKNEDTMLADLPNGVKEAIYFKDIRMAYNDESIKLARIENLIAVSSDEERVASSDIEDGVITITPHKIGNANITIEIANRGKFRFIVEVVNDEEITKGLYIEKDGQVVINAGDYSKGCGAGAVSNKWYTCKQTIHLNEGKNVIRLNARESGIYLKQIMLSLETPKGLSGWQTSSEVK